MAVVAHPSNIPCVKPSSVPLGTCRRFELVAGVEAASKREWGREGIAGEQRRAVAVEVAPEAVAAVVEIRDHAADQKIRAPRGDMKNPG